MKTSKGSRRGAYGGYWVKKKNTDNLFEKKRNEGDDLGKGGRDWRGGSTITKPLKGIPYV